MKSKQAQQIPSQNYKIIETLNSNHSIFNQVLFMLSTILYHSTDYFLIIGHQSKKISTLVDLIFYSQTNIIIFQILCIISFIFFIGKIWVKFGIQNKEYYSIELFQKILVPILIMMFIKVYKINSNPQQDQTQKFYVFSIIDSVFYLIVILSFLLVVFKCFKINFRYQKNKSINSICSYNKILLLIKLTINIMFSFTQNKHVYEYIVLMSIVNLAFNGIYNYKIIYEQPGLEYIEGLSQFYMWMPVLIVGIQHFNPSSGYIWIAGVMFNFIYLYLGLSKPIKYLFFFIQQKYLKQIQRFTNIIKSNTFKQQVQSSKSFIIMLLLILSIIQQQNSISIYKNMKWSRQFQFKLLQMLQMIYEQTILVNFMKSCEMQERNKLLKDKNVKNTKFQVVQEEEEQQQILAWQYICVNQNHVSNIYKSKQKRQKLHQHFLNIIWNYLVQIQIFTDYNATIFHHQIFSYICYNFPCITPVMKYRFFYVYYSDANSQNQGNFIRELEKKILYGYLKEKFLSMRFTNTTKANKLIQQISCQKKSFSKPNQFLPYYDNQDYNQIIKQQSYHHKIINNIFQFYLNEQYYLTIFQNLKQNKGNILNYYEKRNQIRNKLQEQIDEYKMIKNKREIFVVFLEYFKEMFMNKNVYKAKMVFRKLVEQNADRKIVKSSGYQANYKKSIFTKNHKSNNGTQAQIYSKQICIISAVQQPGIIKLSCNKFKTHFQISIQKHHIIDNKPKLKHHINQLILYLFRNKHLNYVNDINDIFGKNINHQKLCCNFMISLNYKNVYEVKFKMYFLMSYERDLLVVIDFLQLKQIKNLIIKDHNRRLLFEYCIENGINNTIRLQKQLKQLNQLFSNYQKQVKNSSMESIRQRKMTQLSIHRFRTQSYLQQIKLQLQKNKYQDVFIFNKNYNIKRQFIIKQQQIQYKKYKQIKPNRRTSINQNLQYQQLDLDRKDTQQQEREDHISISVDNLSNTTTNDSSKQQQQQNEQNKFISYKDHFRQKFKKTTRNTIFLSLISVIIILFTTIFLILYQQSSHSILLQKLNRQNYLDHFLMVDQHKWRVYIKFIKIIDNLQIPPQQKYKLQQKIFLNIQSTKIQIQKKNILFKLFEEDKQINNYLYSQNRINDRNHMNSFMYHLQRDQYWLYEFNQSIVKQMNGNRYLSEVFEFQSYFEEDNWNFVSFMEQRYHLFIINIEIKRHQLLYGILGTVLFVYLSFLLYTYRILKFITSNYTFSINVSKRFREKFQQDLDGLYELLNGYQININDEIYQNMRKLGFKNQENKNLRSQLNKKNINSSYKSIGKSLKAIQLIKFQKVKQDNLIIQQKNHKILPIQTYSFIFIGFFVCLLNILAVVFFIFYVNSEKMNKLQHFELGRDKLQEINSNIIQTTLFLLQKSTLPGQNYLNDTTFFQKQQVFIKNTKQLSTLNKIQLIQNLFPNQQQIQKYFQYEKLNNNNKCSFQNYQTQIGNLTASYDIKNCQKEEKNKINFNYLFDNISSILKGQFLIDHEINMFIQISNKTHIQLQQFSQHIFHHLQGQYYQTFNNILRLTQQISIKGMQQFEKYNLTENKNIISFLYGYILVLVMSMGIVFIVKLKRIVNVFGEQFLRISAIIQLKRQQGFKYFTYQAEKSKQSFKQSNDQFQTYIQQIHLNLFKQI